MFGIAGRGRMMLQGRPGFLLVASFLACAGAFCEEPEAKEEKAAYSVRVSPADARIVVVKGTVEARNGKGGVKVASGQKTIMRREVKPSAPQAADIEDEVGWALQGPLMKARLMRGLVGWWKFDEGGGDEARDSSPYGHHGRLKGPRWTTGVIGGALEFDGSGAYVDIGDPPVLELTGPLSLCAWVKVNRYSTNGRIVCKQDGPGRRGWSMNVEKWNIVRMQIPWDTNKTVSVDSPPTPEGEWMHVVTVYDAPKRTMYLYLNGSLKGTRTDDVPPQMFNADLDVRIGGRHGGGCYFAGSVDEVRIYSRPLDAAEVKALYRISGGKSAE